VKKKIPVILQGEYEIEYQYDTQSFLNYYNKIFTNAIDVINQTFVFYKRNFQNKTGIAALIA